MTPTPQSAPPDAPPREPSPEPAREGFGRRTLLRWGAAGGAGVALGPLAACAGPTGAPGPGTLTLGLNRSLVSLDNKLNQFDAAVTVQRAVRQALTRIGPGMKPRLILADRFEMAEPTAWSVRLRDGVCYSDGSPITVEDVATALGMYGKVNGSFLLGLFPELPTVEKTGPRTFLLHTRKPVPVLDRLMANIHITPAAANRPEELQTGLGSGPYRVLKANAGAGEYTLGRNPKYWGARPRIETVRVRFVPEESSRVVALRSGELDVVDTLTPDSAEQLTGLPGVQVEETSGVRMCQLFYNFRKPEGTPLADPRVRRALTYAIDGDALVNDVLNGSAEEAGGVVPLALEGAVRTGSYAYDPGKARALLRSLGATDLRIKIIWESGEFAADTSVMEAVLDMLKAVGVRASLQQFEPGGDILTWRQGRAGDWDVIGNGYGSPTGQALTTLQGMYGGTAEKERTRDAFMGYVIPRVEQQLTAASTEVDDAERNKRLAVVQKAIWDTWPSLWAFAPKTLLARRTRVRGLSLLPINSYDLSAVRLEG
ncbi:ABC transporter substrate-binding protein [Streptomyces scopuliridis]|uniref:ABC transporter substrate-binding protein n=1 Tax=Streptomyces scopuliridis TaxID=452529 RepID=A0ACD4ZWL4_9ACTN|nr:ABC transporter substrate-binding protein [Streptomyces scopuliridis]WSB38151.1 ABC transporter substrate-binding protein [Streptomyces scopuliridis]WSC02584.1 ABC transporter substrate-binding protein [Streptomyces scopuliridis]WSC03884.1 ABC transporter substrate-binding protein [Streptomyces scopuliridis]